jgi:hypothetical protein
MDLLTVLKGQPAASSWREASWKIILSSKVTGYVGEHMPALGAAIPWSRVSFEVRTVLQQCDFQRFPCAGMNTLFSNAGGQDTAGHAGADNSEIVGLISHAVNAKS